MKKELEHREKKLEMQLKLKELELKNRDTPVTKEALSLSVVKKALMLPEVGSVLSRI